MGKVVCAVCGGKCSGEVLRVSSRYFHAACFCCRVCSASLASGGFFQKDGHYYCPQDYQRAFGTRCAACNQYVEGEVVSALGNTYHQKCFTCARCNRAFPSGEKVTYTGSEVVCSACCRPPAAPPVNHVVSANHVALTNHQPHTNHVAENGDKSLDQNECAGCGQELSEGQALVALDRQWHPWCFRCVVCGAVLAGEYMSASGAPHCERCFQRLHGVRCAHCGRFVAGKVLQAGADHHFHPTCARCSKCGEPFGDGEEMFLQGAAVWHPRCGPAPGDRPPSANDTQWWSRSRSPSAGSYTSPYNSVNRKLGGSSALGGSSTWESPQRLTTYSYLTAGAAPLRRPVQPAPPASPHFHRPPSASSTRPSSRASKSSGRPGMTALLDSMRPPHLAGPPTPIDNEEPIELSHYPSAYKPPPGTKSKIEQDDFPAPPYPYTDPERRRRWSDSYKGVGDSDEEADAADGHGRLAREEQELSKIDSGIAQVFLKEVKEREKLQQWKKQNLDPRNASRTPSARHEAGTRLRYSSPVGASPSRQLDSHSHSHSHSPAHTPLPSYNVLTASTRPGSGLRAATLPSAARNGDFTFSGMMDKTHSTDFSSGKSDISAGSITDVDRSAVTTTEELVQSRGGVGGVGSAARGYVVRGGVRRSLPNMVTSALLHEPARLYAYHLLLTTNYRLPADVDRLNLERHLSDAEFEAILQVSRADFYRLPLWRRNELKRRARLF